MGKTIGVISIKGGVGKTSSVVSLGAAMSDFGKKVLLVDANFSAPNLGYHLNIIDPEITLHHAMNRLANLRDAIYVFSDNLHILPASMFGQLMVNPLKLKDKLSYWKNNYDYVLIDSSPALNDETLGAMLASDELLVVTTPDLPTLGTTLKAIKVARQRDTPIIGLILNKVHNKNFELSLEEIEEATEIPVMAVIPHDINILKSLSEFLPMVNYKPNSKASEEYKKLAATLIGEKYKPIKLKNLFGWISPSREEINRQVFYTRVFKDSEY